MYRHDLVYLHPDEAFNIVNASLPSSVTQAIDKMIVAKQPFTICRQSTQYISKVATSYVENNRKYRLALLLSMAPKVVTRPLALCTLIPSLPEQIQQQTQDFIDHCIGFNTEVYAYGSFANQYLTNLAFVTPSSDLDILIVVNDMDRLIDILLEIQHFKNFAESKMSLRIDGEVRLNDYQDVSFNELIHAILFNISTVIVKTLYEVELQTIATLLGWNTDEYERFFRAYQRNFVF